MQSNDAVPVVANIDESDEKSQEPEPKDNAATETTNMIHQTTTIENDNLFTPATVPLKTMIIFILLPIFSYTALV